ncbi:clavaminate synthase-like protein [Senna tora]|uniref:Clavaminate synthase-like protein n=1 Tax=Senna tora TaxID=362788 RepID=A0A834WQB5_9FABA|nr:clavaminate synthase-like protein [Senna tora]
MKVGKCEGQKEVDGEMIPLMVEPEDPNKNDLESLQLCLKNKKEWYSK